MQVVGNVITKRKSGDFDNLKINKQLLKCIVEDMKENAGMLSPIKHWHLVNSDEEQNEIPTENIADKYEGDFDEQYESAEKMLDAWIGCEGLKKLTLEDIKRHEKYLKGIDKLGLINSLKLSENVYDYKKRDIASIVEMNELNEICTENHAYMLEVGGGYGRTAEAVMNIFSDVKYVMVDAVPGSLLYAYEYLSLELPNKKVGFYYKNDEFDMEKYDIYIMPAWHFEKENTYKYDICLNITSMEEMGQNHVDYYLGLFDRMIKMGGHIYLKNSHDYVFKGIWNIDHTWRRMLMYNSLDSWTDYFPTEIFEKTNINCENWNSLIQEGYEYMLDEKKKVEEQKENLQNKIWELEYIKEQYDELEKKTKNVGFLLKTLLGRK